MDPVQRGMVMCRSTIFVAAIPNEGRFRMKSSLLGACATIALLAAAPALAADPAISYVPAQAGI